MDFLTMVVASVQILMSVLVGMKSDNNNNNNNNNNKVNALRISPQSMVSNLAIISLMET